MTAPLEWMAPFASMPSSFVLTLSQAIEKSRTELHGFLLSP